MSKDMKDISLKKTYRRKHSASSAVRETQMKTTMRCHYTSPRMAKIKHSYNIQILARMWRKETTQHCW